MWVCRVLPYDTAEGLARFGLRFAMSKSLLSVTTATIFFASTLTASVAQETTQPNVQPVAIMAGQSGGAGTSGGSTSGGATVEAPARLRHNLSSLCNRDRLPASSRPRSSPTRPSSAARPL
jgi:hypothetical protein